MLGHDISKAVKAVGRFTWEGLVINGALLTGQPAPTQAFMVREARGLAGLDEDEHATRELSDYLTDPAVRRDLAWYNDPDCGAETEDQARGRELEARMRANVAPAVNPSDVCQECATWELGNLPRVPDSQISGTDPLAGKS